MRVLQTVNQTILLKACKQILCVSGCTCSHGNNSVCTWRFHNNCFYVWSFFSRSFYATSSINYNESETFIVNISIHDPKFDLFLSPCQKSRIFESIWSLLLFSKFGDFLLVFWPYLEFSSLLKIKFKIYSRYMYQ